MTCHAIAIRAFPILFAACLAAGPVPAQGLSPEDVLGRAIRARADSALAVLGISAVPSETASSLVFDTGPGSKSGNDFSAAQLGGGFTFSESFPLYLEGYVGYNRYDPVFVLSGGTDQQVIPAKWTSLAATGGIGWDFSLTEHLALRPALHLTLGTVISDTAFISDFVADAIGVEGEFLKSGSLTAGGVGGSVSLVYNRRWTNDVEADLILRHTHIHLEPIAGDKDVSSSAEAVTTALWSRLRLPTGYDAFGGPIRGVTEFSASWLPGDQGEILNTEWLAQVGFGYEIDITETWVPYVTTTRLMFRYAKGEYLNGYSIGLAASF